MLAIVGCGLPSPEDETALTIQSITPALGSVAGGTRVVIDGTGFTATTTITIGTAPCTAVAVEGSNRLSCTTGSTGFVEGAMDVIAEHDERRAMLPDAFSYECLWTTTSGRRSCGAAPPGQVAEQPIDAWLTKFEVPHGFIPDVAMRCDLADTSDFVLGHESVWLETDGAGTVASIRRLGGDALDFRDRMFKIWVKVDNVAHLAAFDVWLGDSGLSNAFKFRLRSTQGQQWTTEGDWVAFTVPWSPVIAGSPDRGSITDVMIRAADDATGEPVRLHVNGIALVPEPVERYPKGVVSFTFDDGWESALPGERLLRDRGLTGTAYVIVDSVGEKDRASLADLEELDAAGWDIAVHSYTDQHHFDRFPNVPASELEDDLVDARAWLIEHGFDGYDHCAYPGGEFTGATDVLGIAGRYFTSCRTVFEKQQETYPPADGRKLRVLLVTSGVSLATVEQTVQEAKRNREWLILVFHELAPVPTRSTEWPTADFATLVDYVANSGIPVQSVATVLTP